MSRTLELLDYRRGRRALAYRAAIGGSTFGSSFRYESVDLLELERRHGRAAMRSLYCHAIAFDLNRLISLAPDAVHFGPLADLVTRELWDLWTAIYQGVWAQWRYENDLPGYGGPTLAHRLAASASEPVTAIAPRAAADSTRSLLFCGGGKDSLLAAKLFEELDEPHDSLAYSHSVYGDAEPQHALIDGLLDHCVPRRRHRLRIEDDFLGSGLDLEPFGVRTIAAGETPGALFLALPIALAHGLENLVVAHERSADRGSLIWDATGEEINHQWGKSLEAERLLGDYVERHIVAGARYWSALKPLSDPVIFAALRDYPEAIPATHSCNVEKPWCRRCAKCLYVFLGYAAWLPREVVEETFGENLFEVEENLGLFAQLLGLQGHLPFECVGQVEDSRLALALAAERGWTGSAIERSLAAVAPDWTRQAAELSRDSLASRDRFPGVPGDRLRNALARRVDAARRSVEHVLTAP